MEEFHLYKDIKARTGGEIFLGVVGPVRTGKSTFVRHFMELLVLPNLKDNGTQICAQGGGSFKASRSDRTEGPAGGLRGLSCDRSRRHHGEGKAPHGENALGGRRDAL